MVAKLHGGEPTLCGATKVVIEAFKINFDDKGKPSLTSACHRRIDADGIIGYNASIARLEGKITTPNSARES